MPKLLTQEQVEAYHRGGFLFPIRIMDSKSARQLRQKLESIEKTIGAEVQNRYRIKAHLPFPWLNRLIRNSHMLDAVEDIIGPNILCWGSSFFTKNAHDPRFVSWHQDTTYYGLEPRETLTAWFAFTDSNVQSGCMRVIPGSHSEGTRQHMETFAEDNLLSRGQTVEDVDESLALDMELKAGEISFHSETIIHGSNPNQSGDRRLGYSIHFIAPHVRQTLFNHATATLLRGTDTHGHWEPEPVAQQDFDPNCLAALDRNHLQYKANQQGGSAEPNPEPPAGSTTNHY